MKIFKKLALSILGVAVVSVPSFAVNKSNTGCGLGYVIFKDQPDTLVFDLLAITTNGTSANNLFGITSGTLECKQPERIVKNDKLFKFVSENMDNISSDVASGNGEYLETVAELLNIEESKKDKFFAKLQENFDSIFPSENVQSADVIDKIVEIAEEV